VSVRTLDTPAHHPKTEVGGAPCKHLQPTVCFDSSVRMVSPDVLLTGTGSQVSTSCICCRVHTLAVPIAQDLNSLYAGADTGAIACVIAKLAVEKSLHGKLEVPPWLILLFHMLLALRRVCQATHNTIMSCHCSQVDTSNSRLLGAALPVSNIAADRQMRRI
jgi:hypothetical protein